MTAGATAEDLIGRRFGDWLVLERRSSINGDPKWLCRCLCCGVEKPVYGKTLRQGESSRCGKCAQRLRRKAKPSTAQSTSLPSKEDQ